MSGEGETPDFAMLRAVEVLANIYERNRKAADLPPPPLDRPVVLFNEAIPLDVTSTTRDEVEKTLGIAFAYPARGWHTYCVFGANRTREFLSLFYSSADRRLASAELYLPKSDRAPKLEARDLGGFRLVPSEVALGTQVTALPENFARIMAPSERAAYADIFEARFPGGAAYAMGNKGLIERIALYVLKPSSPVS